MSVFGELQEAATGYMRPDPLFGPPLELTMKSAETGAINPGGLAASREYLLTVTVATRFWCNQAQYPEARRTAERILSSLLYEDVLRQLTRIEHAIMDSDGRSAHHLCGELRQRLTR